MTANLIQTKLNTPAEQARACEVSKPTLLAWYHEGIIPAAIAVGRTIRFDHKEVLSALAVHAAKSNREGAR
jgi:predicted site-specific integrase-resolvase